MFGDYDNDGDPDLFVSAGHVFGRDPDGLLRNEAGSCRNVSAEAGLAELLPTDNAIWLDYDREPPNEPIHRPVHAPAGLPRLPISLV